MAHFIHQHSAHIRTPEGLAYVARVYGEPKPDGMWIGWLEFRPLDATKPMLRADHETTQASRDALASWASGLEMVYLEGAFARAQIVV